MTLPAEAASSPVGNEPIAVAVSPDGRTAYVATVGGNDVAVRSRRSG